mgnify:CR=1 FL=1
MAECKECGKRNPNPFGDICPDCLIDSKLGRTKTGVSVDGHLQNPKSDLSAKSANIENSRGSESTSSLAQPASTTFTSLARMTVFISLIASVILGLLLLNDDQGLLAIIVVVSGCFGAVLLGLLAEISTNIARLVNNSR